MSGKIRFRRIREALARPLVDEVRGENEKLSGDVTQLQRDKEVLAGGFQLLEREVVALRTTNEELEQRADTDPLTGLGNRRRLKSIFEREERRVKRGEIKDFAVFAFDLDYFKEVNDKYGHPTGDAYLIKFVSLVNGKLRPLDELFRVGGDEFTAVISNVDRESATVLIERIYAELAANPIKLADEDIRKISVSTGIAFYSQSSKRAPTEQTEA